MLKTFEERCEHGFLALDGELQKIRTGRAHPGLLDGIMVLAYGQPTALQKVASVAVQDQRALAVTPWDRSLMNGVAKAIQESDLGVTPSVLAEKIVVNLPILTQERREEMVRLVRKAGEAAKVQLRHHRRDILAECKNKVKQKEWSEDEEKRHTQDIEKIMERFMKQIDQRVVAKEKELIAG